MIDRRTVFLQSTRRAQINIAFDHSNKDIFYSETNDLIFPTPIHAFVQEVSRNFISQTISSLKV